MAGALFADAKRPDGQVVSMPSGVLYRSRGTPDVWHLYFDYEPAPTGDMYATPPLEVPLSHGDEVSPLQPFLFAVGSPASAAPLKPPFHFLGVLMGSKGAGHRMQQCAMLRSGDGRACVAGLGSKHLAKGTGRESFSNELTIEEFNSTIASHSVKAVLARAKLVVEGLARRSERTPSAATPAARAPAAAPAAASAAATATARAAAKATMAKAARAAAKAAEKATAEKAATGAERAAAEKAAAERAAAEKAALLSVGSWCWYQPPKCRKRSVVVLSGPRHDGNYQVQASVYQVVGPERCLAHSVLLLYT